MKITLEGHIMNPMSAKNAVLSNRDMYRKLYTEKFDKILLRYAGNLDYQLYFTKDGKYYIYIKVPSEVVPNFFYDVVIEFYTDNQLIEPSRSLNNYFVKFYANDPAFVYTFAHAFIDNDIFIKELEPKMSSKAVKEIAKERNSKNVIGYVKSIYFAYLWIKSKGLMSKALFETYGKELNKMNELSKQITHADEKIADRQKKGEEIEKLKRKEKEDAKKEQERLKKKDMEHMTSMSKNVNSIKTTKSIASTKKVKSTKRSKILK